MLIVCAIPLTTYYCDKSPERLNIPHNHLTSKPYILQVDITSDKSTSFSEKSTSDNTTLSSDTST